MCVVLIAFLLSCSSNTSKKQTKENENIEMVSKDIKVVFMGNSITEKWAEEHPEFFCNREYIPRGISGQTTLEMLNRFEEDVIKETPDVVVISGGTNDIAEIGGQITMIQISENIKNMIELAETNRIKVVLCSVLPTCAYPWSPQVEPVAKIKELNEWIETYAEEKLIPYVDYFSLLADENGCMKAEYTTDGVHVTKEAYLLMEPLVEEAIEKIVE